MVAAFASAEDLAKRLGRVVWPAGRELDQVTALLEDASAHLREIIGWQVSPPAQVTHTVWDCAHLEIELPGGPISSVSAVTVNGTTQSPSSYELINSSLRRLGGYGGSYPGFEYSHHNRQWVGKVVITYTVGFATAPPDLVSWTCVLASQAMAGAAATASLGAGQTRSMTIGTPAGGTFSRTFETGSETSPFLLPTRVEEALRRRYGGGAFVTGSSR